MVVDHLDPHWRPSRLWFRSLILFSNDLLEQWLFLLSAMDSLWAVTSRLAQSSALKLYVVTRLIFLAGSCLLENGQKRRFPLFRAPGPPICNSFFSWTHQLLITHGRSVLPSLCRRILLCKASSAPLWAFPLWKLPKAYPWKTPVQLLLLQAFYGSGWQN